MGPAIQTCGVTSLRRVLWHLINHLEHRRGYVNIRMIDDRGCRLISLRLDNGSVYFCCLCRSGGNEDVAATLGSQSQVTRGLPWLVENRSQEKTKVFEFGAAAVLERGWIKSGLDARTHDSVKRKAQDRSRLICEECVMHFWPRGVHGDLPWNGSWMRIVFISNSKILISRERHGVSVVTKQAAFQTAVRPWTFHPNDFMWSLFWVWRAPLHRHSSIHEAIWKSEPIGASALRNEALSTYSDIIPSAKCSVGLGLFPLIQIFEGCSTSVCRGLDQTVEVYLMMEGQHLPSMECFLKM